MNWLLVRSCLSSETWENCPTPTLLLPPSTWVRGRKSFFLCLSPPNIYRQHLAILWPAFPSSWQERWPRGPWFSALPTRLVLIMSLVCFLGICNLNGVIESPCFPQRHHGTKNSLELSQQSFLVLIQRRLSSRSYGTHPWVKALNLRIHMSKSGRFTAYLSLTFERINACLVPVPMHSYSCLLFLASRRHNMARRETQLFVHYRAAQDQLNNDIPTECQ